MKKFYVKAHKNIYGTTTHFARYIEADNSFAARIIFEEQYGWRSNIDIIEEVNNN